MSSVSIFFENYQKTILQLQRRRPGEEVGGGPNSMVNFGELRQIKYSPNFKKIVILQIKSTPNLKRNTIRQVKSTSIFVYFSQVVNLNVFFEH